MSTPPKYRLKAPKSVKLAPASAKMLAGAIGAARAKKK
jgi:hypothetical protein